MEIETLPWYRRHTYHFLNNAPKGTTVYLSAEVDMTRIVAHRRFQMEQNRRRFSYISYIIRGASRVIKQFPEVNAGFHDGWFNPCLVRYERILAKVTFDKTIAGRRIVVSHVIADSEAKSLEQLQQIIDGFKKGTAEDIPQLHALQKFQKLPPIVGRFLWRKARNDVRKKQQLEGSFTVTSLGHREIIDFLPVISSTTCLGIGAIRPMPVVEANTEKVRIKPIMKITLGFDHRVLDGALSADLLEKIKTELEQFNGD